MARIELDLAHAYKANPRHDDDYALLPLKMRFDDGGAYALLGPSGCGKTTLLNIVSGLVKPSQGTVTFDGVDVTARTPQQRNIAQVFQFPVIYDTMTVAQNLAFPLKNRGLPAARTSSWPLSSSISAILPTRCLILASATPRLRKGKARFCATVIVS